MISSTTPYKEADIIRDTWPQLYYPRAKSENSSVKFPTNEHSDINISSTEN